MPWIHGFSERLKAFVRRGQLERQLEEDIRFHIKMETEKNVCAGMTEEEIGTVGMGGRTRTIG